jgi:Na+/proline symporter
MTSRLNAITMPEFLSARYGNKPLQVVAALVVFVFLVPYSASVLMGLSYLFEMTLHIPYENALYFLTALTAVYLVMGGYFAVAISDFIRGIIEFAGVLVMVYLLAHRPETGGFVNATSQLLSDPSAAPGLAAVKQLGAGSWLAVSAPGWLTLLALVLITSFGPWALPQMVQKFYSIRSKADVKRAMAIATVFALFMSFGAYYSGALTHLFYGPKLPPELMGAKGPIWDKIMPHFITTSGLPVSLVLIIVLMVFPPRCRACHPWFWSPARPSPLTSTEHSSTGTPTKNKRWRCCACSARFLWDAHCSSPSKSPPSSSTL